MDFLGIGPLELLIIIVIALIVVGPERLPELARSVGKKVQDIRAISSGLTSEWQRELSAVTQDLQGEDLKKALLEPLSDASTDVQKAVGGALPSSSSRPPASRTAPPGGFVSQSPAATPSPEAENAASSEAQEHEEPEDEAVGLQATAAEDSNPSEDVVEEDKYADS
jgi:sec-independent protein translocase protein TatB